MTSSMTCASAKVTRHNARKKVDEVDNFLK
jgi:hypothetical protein